MIFPVFHLNFEKSDGSIILDQSSMSNNAFLEQDGRIVSHQDACGKVADLARYGDIRLDERTFRRKPRNGISIATWVNLHKSSRGSHSLFSTAHAPRGFGSVQGKFCCSTTCFIFRSRCFKKKLNLVMLKTKQFGFCTY